MSKYDGANLIQELNNEYIIYNVNSSRIFSVKKDIENMDDVLQKINSCPKNMFSKEMPTKKYIKNIVISCAEACNLRCKYCFAEGGSYGQASTKVMQDSDYEKLLDMMMSLDYRVESLCLFGGEPLLSFPAVERFLDKLNTYYAEKSWEMPDIGMVTNGTLFTEEIVTFLNKYKINVSVSIDGPKEINDVNRIYADKSKSVYDTVLSKMPLLKNRNFVLGATATISRDRIRNYMPGDYEKLITHFINMGFDIAECGIADETIPLTDDERNNIAEFAKEQVRYLFQKIGLGHNLSFLPRVPLGAVSAIVKKKYVLECPAGMINIFYSANGEEYPCQLYYAAKRKEAHLVSRSDHPICKNCFCVNTCGGYCPGGSVLITGEETGVVETRCVFNKALLEETILQLYKYMNSEKTTKEERAEFTKNVVSLSKTYSFVR